MNASFASLALILTFCVAMTRNPTPRGIPASIANDSEDICHNEMPLVTVNSDGTLEVNRRPMLPLELRLALRDIFSQQVDRAVYLKADRATTYQQILPIIGDLKQLAEYVVLIPPSMEKQAHGCLSFRPRSH